MATKYASPAVHEEEGMMRFEIPGLHERPDGIFELSGVKPLQLEFHRIQKVLLDGGIDERSSAQYLDEFVELVTQGEISKLLARRMKRVG
jgi:hypothetical protein